MAALMRLRNHVNATGVGRVQFQDALQGPTLWANANIDVQQWR
jgi:aminoglycoside/choline kinase family phosphotransferase